MDEIRKLWHTRAGRMALLAVAALTALVLAGVALLWPGERLPIAGEQSLVQQTEEAEVIEVRNFECPGLVPCQDVTFEVRSGPDEGQQRTLPQGGANFVPTYEVGDRLRVRAIGPGAEAEGGDGAVYSIADFDRGSPLLFLALLFGGAVLLVAGLRGASSLLGLGAAVIAVGAFVVPSIAAGNEPVLVAVVGALGIMLITIPASHGLGAKAITALLGTAASLGLAVGLAAFFFSAASISGLAGGEAELVTLSNPEFSLRGLALAGAIIASLGVLDDATVSQSAVITSLRRNSPGLSFRGLFEEGLSVGRDHVTAMVNTLVLAYVGASLPILLLFSAEGAGFISVLNSEVVAVEIVATLVGSIAVIAAVPLTTLIGAALAVRLPPRALPADEHGHHH